MICRDCDKQITPQSKTGRCRLCAIRATNADPIYCAKRAKANRDRMNDPAYKAKAARILATNRARISGDEQFKQRLSEIGRQNIYHTFTPEARKRWQASRAQAARKRTETMIGWCPPQYREEYRRLRHRGDMRAADARRIIEAKLTPFERQMRAVANGARLIEKPAALRRYTV